MPDATLEELYREILLDHYRNPRHRGALDGANRHADGSNPLCGDQVTVDARVGADGTVEAVTFTRTSGLPALDDAVRRVIELQANYPAFPPALAREYDVIEIRRTWHFDTAIRLY